MTPKQFGTGSVFIAAAVFLSSILLASSSEKPVTTVLNAKWGSTPLLLEASEFFAEESEEAFWGFVKSVSDEVVETERESFNLIRRVASDQLSPLKRDLLLFSLSLRENSPKIEMFYQLSKDIQRSNCEAFVSIDDQYSCSADEIPELLNKAKGVEPRVYSFDHHYPSSQANPVTAVLYGHIGSKSFMEFHTALVDLVTTKRVHYILRHFTQKRSDVKTRLSGYGIELAIKSTEYKAIDDTEVKDDGSTAGKVTQTKDDDEVEGFLFNQLKTLHKNQTDDLAKFRKHLIDSTKEMAPLKAWQLQDIGYQAAQRVISAPPDESLRVLRDLSQNIPRLGRSLVKISFESEMRKEIEANQRSLSSLGVEAGDNVFLLNGLVISLEDTDPFVLLKTLRDEAQLMEGLGSLGIPRSLAKKFLSLDIQQAAKKDETFAVDMRSDAVVFVNNLEKDRRYSSWPKTVTEVLRPAFPGTLRRVAKNMFHAVFCVDPAKPDGVAMLNLITLFLENDIPLRMGILMLGESKASVALAKVFEYVTEESGSEEALNWLTESIYDGLVDEEEDVGYEHVYKAFKGEFGSDVAADVLEGETYGEKRKKGSEKFRATGLRGLPQVLVNGVVLKAGRNDVEQEIVSQIHSQMNTLQHSVYYGIINDRTDLYNYWMTRPNVVRRFNSWILTEEQRSLDFYSKFAETSGLTGFGGFSTARQSAVVSAHVRYLMKEDAEMSLKMLTVWLVVDLETLSGRQMVLNAVQHVDVSENVRLGIVPVGGRMNGSLSVGKTVLSVLATHGQAKAMGFVKALLAEDVEKDVDLEKLAGLVEGIKIDKIKAGFDNALELLGVYQKYAENVLELQSGQSCIVVNGKVIGPLPSDEVFLAEDFSLLEISEMKHYGTSVKSLINGMSFPGENPDDDTSEYWSNLFVQISSLLLSKSPKRRVPDVSLFENYSCVHISTSEDSENLGYEMAAIVDPLSKGAQRMSALLMVLQNVTHIDLKMYMNPVAKLSEMPVKRFYRYVLEPLPQFNKDGSLSAGPAAVFADLPEEPLFTLNMDVPKSWMVESVSCVYDLDNIHLADVEQGIYAEFELANILIEGQCIDSSVGQPIRGLQFVLGTSLEPEKFDTIVMANLGYFQLKANAGAWILKLRGRSADIYEITSHSGTDPKITDQMLISLASFSGKFLQIRASKKKGKENEDVLEGGKDLDTIEEESFWDSLSNYVGGSKPDVISGSSSEEEEVINVFSLASGHLYERFLRIMMVSVLKHASIPVKFWFLKNFLSPTFKAFLPAMAEEYGFAYELVEYKWPHWLHGQTEKQRLIWGYKILFLDVLFPLNVKKIIYVDADQIVRADLKELVDMDLENAPYAYTPFCDDRKEMDGFRFWKSGYWRSHLGGRKYHISALYVIDLTRFRQLAAGDRLRSQYQGLSQDPNSLANLDQDLPNNMIHQVAIKSLPQEWLWCETWCSNESKPKAKTIDLCNNPLTKEPKLKAAVRIVAEWQDYDNEIRQFQERVASNKSSKSKPEGKSTGESHTHIDL